MNEDMAHGRLLIYRYCESDWQSMKKIHSQLNAIQNIHEHFRLWIVVEEKDRFPPDVLRKSVKGDLTHSVIATA